CWAQPRYVPGRCLTEAAPRRVGTTFAWTHARALPGPAPRRLTARDTATSLRPIMSFRLPLLLALFLAVGLVAGCDSDDLDDRDTAAARSLTFTLDDRDNRGDFLFDRTFSTSGNEVQYEGAFSDLTPRVVNDGIVLLYVRSEERRVGKEWRSWSSRGLGQ